MQQTANYFYTRELLFDSYLKQKTCSECKSFTEAYKAI